MAGVKLCGECGVPLLVSRGQTWHDNGVITETKDPDHRMIFFESENLDQVFHKIEETIGVSIERLVVESQRRSTREYLEKLIPKAVRRLLTFFRPGLIADRMAKIAGVFGYGHVEVLEMHVNRLRLAGRPDDRLVMTISDPYSIYRFSGDNLGGMEAATGRTCTVTREKLDDSTYRLEITVGHHPVELEERLARRQYGRKPGNIELPRCRSCGVPLGVARCRWDLVRGIITDPETGRRMTLIGPASLDAAFDDLEEELGEAIPETVIEAQRQYVRESLRPKDWKAFSASPVEALAIRGLGMLTEFEADDSHLTVSIQNACLHLWTVGIMQGLFELGSGHGETKREWDLSPDGDLNVRITRP